MPHCRMVHALLCPAVSRHALHVGMIHSGHSSLGCDGSGNACCKLPGRILLGCRINSSCRTHTRRHVHSFHALHPGHIHAHVFHRSEEHTSELQSLMRI